MGRSIHGHDVAPPFSAPPGGRFCRSRRRRALAAGSVQTLGGAVAGQVTGTGTGTGPTVLSGPGTGPARYVALGDSYAAVGRIAPGAWVGGPVACVRTADAYPTVVAHGLGVGTFVNASCGGAVAHDFTGVGRTGAPPQFDALTAATASLSKGVDPTTGCSDVIDRQAAAALQDLDQRMDAVYAGIAERAPRAQVVTVGYLAAVPEEDEVVRNSPSCAPFLAISAAERAKVRGFQDSINRVVRAAAERNGATVVIPDEPGHSMCTDPGTRWVDFTGLETGAVPVHPTSAGHAHVAGQVVKALGQVKV